MMENFLLSELEEKMKNRILMLAVVFLFASNAFTEKVSVREERNGQSIYMVVEDEKVSYRDISGKNYIYTKNEDFKISMETSVNGIILRRCDPYRLGNYDLPFWQASVMYGSYYVVEVSSYILQDNQIFCPYISIGNDNYFPSENPVYFRMPFSGVCTFLLESSNYEGILGSGYSIQNVKIDGSDCSPLLNEYYNLVNFSIDDEGFHTVELFAVDKIGNSAGGKLIFCFDKTGPEISVDSEDKNWFNSGVKISANACDAVSGVNEESWRNRINTISGFSGTSSGNREIFIEDDGIFSIQFMVSDKAGNESKSIERTIRIDKCPPIIKTDILSETNWISSNRVEAFAEDSLSGIDENSWESFVDGIRYGNKKIVENLADGFHIVRFKVSDVAGNYSEKEFSIHVDKTPPFISDFACLSKNGLIVPSIYDETSGINAGKTMWSIDNQNWTLGSEVLLNEGVYDLAFYAEDMACNSVSKKCPVTVDWTPPEIDFYMDSVTREREIVLRNFSVKDSIFSNISTAYSIDERSREAVHWIDGEDLHIPVYRLEEGSHVLNVYAEDGNGNNSKKQCGFIIDKTKPVIESIEYSSCGKEIEAGDYIRCENPFDDDKKFSIKVNVEGYDKAGSEDGRIRGVLYSLNHGNFMECESLSFTVNDFYEGINVLSIKIVDWTGNESETSEVCFVKNSQVPLPPKISSTTHKAAKKTSDATGNNSGNFHIRSVSADNSEIQKIEWSLYKCKIDQDGKVIESSKKQVDEKGPLFIDDFVETEISYDFLEDNEENEFYCISSMVTGKNSLVSKRNDFVFRIDSSKPEGFKSWLYPQVDDERWYNGNFVSLNWIQGKDRSGIGKIEYSVASDLSNSFSKWNTVPDLSKNSLWLQLEGKNQIAVKCVDSVGNYDESLLSVNIDSKFPFFENENDFVCEWEKEEKSENILNAVLKWPKIHDDESGVDCCKVRIHCIDENVKTRDKIFYFIEEKNDCVVRNLDSSCDYLIEITAVDKAGNEEARSFVLPGVNSADKTYVDYELDYYYRNFHFEGVVRNYFREGKVVLLDDGKLIFSPLSFFIYSEDELVNFIEIDKDRCIFSNGRVKKAWTKVRDGKYRVIFESQRFIADYLVFESNSGLSLEKAEYTQKTKDGECQIEFNKIYFGFPEHFSIASDFTTMESSDIESDWFTLETCTSFEFKNDRKNFGKQFMETKNINIKDEEGNNRIKTYESSLDMDDGNLFSRPFYENNVLEINEKCKLVILDSFFQNDRLYVNDSILNTVSGKNVVSIHFSDFYVSEIDGAMNTDAMSVYVLNEKDEKEFNISFDGVNVNLDGIVLKNNSMYVSFYLRTPYGDVSFKDAELNNFGLHFDRTFTEEFEILFNGFKLRCNEYSISIFDNVPCLKIIKGYFSYMNVQFDFENMILDVNVSNRVIVQPESIENKMLNTGYGRTLLFENIRIASDGIFTDINLPLPGSEKTILLEHVNIFPDGSMNYFKQGDIGIDIGAVHVNCSRISFNGYTLCLDSGVLDSSKMNFYFEEHRIDSLCFSGIKMNYEDTVDNGKWNYESFLVYHGDFKIHAFDISIKKQGLSFKGLLKTNFKYNNGIFDANLRFQNIYVNEDCKLACDYSNEDQIVNFFGHSIHFENCHIDYDENSKPVVISEREFLEIPERECTVRMNFGKIVFYGDGSFICDEKENDTMFLSSNDGLVDIFETKITAAGIILSGSLSFDNVSFYYGSENFFLLLNTDLSIETLSPIKNFQWTCGEWEIFSDSMDIRKNSIVIENNYVLYKERKIHLGTFTLDNDFTFPVPQTNRIEQNVKLYGDSSTIVYSSFSARGLFCDVVVFFPGWMNDEFTLLENVQLYSDGTFSDPTPVEHISITGSNFNADFYENRFVKEYLSIWKSEIYLKELDSTVTLYNSKIYHDGKFEVEDGSVSSFELWGMEIQVDNLSADSEGIFISGIAVLPEKLPGCLSSKRAEINKLKIGWGGSIIDMDISTDVYSSLEIFGNWKLSADKVHVILTDSEPFISFDNSWIEFPPEYLIKRISVANAAFSLKTCEFDFSKITCDFNARMTFCGIQYEFNSISISRDFTVGLRGSASFIGDNFPEFLKDKVAVDAFFEIDRNGEIIAFNTSVSGLNGKISKNIESIEVSNGAISLEKRNDEYYGSIKGNLVFSKEAPEGLKNREINIEKFLYNITDHSIIELKASTLFDSIDFFGFEIENLRVGIEWNGSSENSINLGGVIVLPKSLPEPLSGTRIDIEKFTIDAGGNVSAFCFSYDYNGNLNLQKGLVMKNPRIKSDDSGTSPLIEIKCGLEFSKSYFSNGLCGMTTEAIVKFSSSGIEFIYADFYVPEIDVFNSISLKSGYISFSITESKVIVFSVRGNLVVKKSNFFPDGLSGAAAEIKILRFSADGTLLEIDASFNIDRLVFFDSVEINSLDINLSGDDGNELFFNVKGNVAVINDFIPQEFKKVNFRVNKIQFSTVHGITDFSLSVEGDLTFNILKGIEISLFNLDLSKDGFSCSAASKFVFNDSLEGFEFTIPKFSMDWSGNIKSLSGGSSLIEFSLAGFKSRITGLNFIHDSSCEDGFSVSLTNLRVSMPENCHMSDISISNAGFKNGSFYGVLDDTELYIDIAGFKLAFLNPYIDMDNRELGFSGVSMECPDLLNNCSLFLYGVSISAYEGLRIHGVSLTLPNFTVGNGYGFRDVNVTFIKDGSDFLLAGSGKLSIPNAGEICAELSFTNVSEDYPIGLKHAFFSFEATGFSSGIPLGNTGLYLTGIRGGLSYGYPFEVNVSLQPFYGPNGIRIQLGLTVHDAFAGNLVEMKPDTWIDVENGIWGMYGYAVVLRGKVHINGNALAVLGPFGFTTNMDFNIVFCRGRVSFSVFKAGGTPLFTGSAHATFVIPEGSILSFKINLLFTSIRVNIPPFDINVFSLNTEFGDFTNGYRGFKSCFNVFGYDIGVFAAWAYLRVGNVTSYQLYDPMIYMLRNEYELKNELNLKVEDDGFPLEILMKQRNTIPFTVEKNLSKISLICAYEENVPEIKLRSADGKIYSTRDDHAEVLHFDGYYIFSVENPSCGEWCADISCADKETYKIILLNVDNGALIDFQKVSVSGEDINVIGNSNVFGKPIYFYLTDEERKYSFYLGESVSDEMGKFEFSGKFDDFADGKYFLAAKAIEKSGMLSNNIYFEKPIYVVHENEVLKAPEDFRIFEDQDMNVNVRFSNPNGARAYGFFIEVENETGEVFLIDAGKVMDYHLIEGITGKKYRYRVCCYNKEKNKGIWTDYIEHEIGSELNKKIQLLCDVKEIDLGVMEPGSYIDGNIEVYEEDESENFYVVGSVEDCNENVCIAFSDYGKPNNGKKTLSWNTSICENCKPGKYRIGTRIFDERNVSGFCEVFYIVEVKQSELFIESVYPEKLNGQIENTVFISGKGLSDGCRYYLDDEELPVIDNDSYYSQRIKKVLIGKNEYAGVRNLIVENPKGERKIFPIEFINPYYELKPRIRRITVSPGKNYRIPIDVKRICDYSGEIKCRIESSSKEIVVAKSDSFNDSFYVDLHINNGCDEGIEEIKIVYGNSQVAKIIVLVEKFSNRFAPSIDCIEPKIAYAGKTVELYGKDFSKNSEVLINSKSIPFNFIDENRISIEVTREMYSGVIEVTNEFGISNGKSLTIKKHYLDLDVEKSFVQLDRSNKNEIPFRVYSDTKDYDLELIYDTKCPIEAKIKKLIPYENYYSLCIDAENLIATENLSIGIKAKSAYSSDFREVKIYFNCDKFINDKEVYSGIIDKEYYAELNVENCDSKCIFTVANGRLPRGIALSNTGVLSGIPKECGLYEFTVRAGCDEIPVAEKSVHLEICWNYCTSMYFDSSNSMNGNDFNSDSHKEKNIDVQYELEYGGIEIQIMKNELNAKTGDCDLWSFECLDEIIEARISGGKLFVYLKNKKLLAIDLHNGIVVCSWENVHAFSSNLDTVILARDNKVFLYKSSTCELKETKNNWNGLLYEDSLFVGNKIYTWKNRLLRKLTDSGQIKCIVSGKILRCLSDGNFVYVITESDLYKISLNLKISCHKEFDFSGFQNASVGEKLIVKLKDGTFIFSKNNLEVILDE